LENWNNALNEEIKHQDTPRAGCAPNFNPNFNQLTALSSLRERFFCGVDKRAEQRLMFVLIRF